MSEILLGLRTVIYPAPDLDGAKRWYASVLGVQPYFDEPFYVGFDVGGYELGLDPDPAAAGSGPRTYWGVEDADAALSALLDRGPRHTPGWPTSAGESGSRRCSIRPATSSASSRIRTSRGATSEPRPGRVAVAAPERYRHGAG
jgi:catechol 2,3-dioxygenase-like lactoylglutathione lyase family enzyme